MTPNDPKLSHGHRSVTPKCNRDNQISYHRRNARRGGRWLQRGVRRQHSITHKLSNKNLRLLNNHPNLLHTLEAAKLKSLENSMATRDNICEVKNMENVKRQPNKQRKQNHQ